MAGGSRGVTGARALAAALVCALLTTLLTATASPASAAVGFTGHLDGADSPAPGQVRVQGWVFDNDAPPAPVRVHVYVGGRAGDPGAVGYDLGPATVPRSDVGAVYPGAGPNHGFSWTIDVPLHGTREVSVYAIDVNGGANELLDARVVTIANPPPQTTISASPAASTSVPAGTTTTATYAFAASEPGSTFACSWDGGPWAGCTSPTSAAVGVGAHTFAVRATDAEGAPDPTPASHAFSVLALPEPVVVPPPPPPPPPPVPRLGLSVRAVEKGSKVRIDIGPDLEQSNYRLVVQRARGKAWRTLRRTQTLGPRDRVVLDLPRGHYRIVVPPQQGMAGARATVRLRR